MSGYYPASAQGQALARRRRLAKLARHAGLLAHVMDRVRAGWSPQRIAGRLRLDKRDGADGEAIERLCHETIYRHVYGPERRTEQLHLCLPRARRRRGTRHGRRPRGHRIPLERGIACRPAGVATRESFGHWEGDPLVFAKSGGNASVTTLVERRSCFLVLLPNPDRRPAGVAQRIRAALGGLALDRGLAVTSYLCDPRSPWQKGAVENANGRLRRHLPSDASAERLTASSLDALAMWLNATPRQYLGYCMPAEVLTAIVRQGQPKPAQLQPCRIGDCDSTP